MSSDLSLIPAFENLDREYLDLLGPLFESHALRTGAVVLQQGAPAEYLYLILKGAVEMSFKPDDGAPITISHVEKGGWFGWSAIVGSETYTSSAIAIAELETVRIHGDDLRTLCAEHPKAGKVILERLADNVSSRWKDAHRQLRAILAEGIASRQL
jgi:CRP-like cAMP-binding protein